MEESPDNEIEQKLMEIIHLSRVQALKFVYEGWKSQLDEEEERDLEVLLKKFSLTFQNQSMRLVMAALYGTTYLLEVDHYKHEKGEDTVLKYEEPEEL